MPCLYEKVQCLMNHWTKHWLVCTHFDVCYMLRIKMVTKLLQKSMNKNWSAYCTRHLWRGKWVKFADTSIFLHKSTLYLLLAIQRDYILTWGYQTRKIVSHLYCFDYVLHAPTDEFISSLMLRFSLSWLLIKFVRKFKILAAIHWNEITRLTHTVAG